MTCTFIGLGQPVVDYSIAVSQDFAEKFPGGHALVDTDTIRGILENYHPEAPVAAGSCGNLCKTLARQGRAVTFMGSIGTDPLAAIYRTQMTAKGVLLALEPKEGMLTGQSAILVPPDGERTMLTHLGCGTQCFDVEMSASKGAHVHFEGYLFGAEGQFERMRPFLAGAQSTSLDLGSPGFLTAHGSKVLNALESHRFTVLFGNESEYQTLMGIAADEAVVKLAEKVDVVVATKGAQGGVWASKGLFGTFAAEEVDVVDTTGAGDAFMAGFLHKYCGGGTIVESCEEGAALGAKIVGVRGTELP